MQSFPRLKRILKPLLILSISTLVGLLIAEAISRLLPWQPEPPIKIYDEKIGFRLRPGLRGTWTIENPGHFIFNTYGFRDVEWMLKKGKKHRVAILGDSFVEALQINLEQSFPKLIEDNLKNVEVMNFAISGQGQVEELLTYRYCVRPFKPDLVVLCFFPGNDPLDNWRRHKPSSRFPVYAKAFSNGVDLIPVPGIKKFEPLRRIIDWTHYHFSLMQRIQDVRRSFLRYQKGRLTEAGLWEGAFGNPGGVVPDFDEIWDLTENLLLQLYRDVTADTGYSSRLLMVCLTEGVQVHRSQRDAFVKQYPSLDPDYSEKRIQAFCKFNGIPFLALSPDMIRYNQSTGNLLHGFDGRGQGHFNINGHKVAADSISGRLKRMLP